tara:strand:+ start:51 stop:482 length:432 start_codon:yes stop_codon:yes gene_type:complete
MPIAEREFIIKKQIRDIWDFFTDLNKVGHCLDGVEKVETIDRKSANLTLKIKFGFIIKEIKLFTKFIELDPIKLVRFKGEGKELDIIGEFKLIKKSKDETSVYYKMNIEGKGSLKNILHVIIKSTIKEKTDNFIKTVENRLIR